VVLFLIGLLILGLLGPGALLLIGLAGSIVTALVVAVVLLLAIIIVMGLVVVLVRRLFSFLLSPSSIEITRRAFNQKPGRVTLYLFVSILLGLATIYIFGVFTTDETFVVEPVSVPPAVSQAVVEALPAVESISEFPEPTAISSLTLSPDKQKVDDMLVLSLLIVMVMAPSIVTTALFNSNGRQRLGQALQIMAQINLSISTGLSLVLLGFGLWILFQGQPQQIAFQVASFAWLLAWLLLSEDLYPDITGWRPAWQKRIGSLLFLAIIYLVTWYGFMLFRYKGAVLGTLCIYGVGFLLAKGINTRRLNPVLRARLADDLFLINLIFIGLVFLTTLYAAPPLGSSTGLIAATAWGLHSLLPLNQANSLGILTALTRQAPFEHYLYATWILFCLLDPSQEVLSDRKVPTEMVRFTLYALVGVLIVVRAIIPLLFVPTGVSSIANTVINLAMVLFGVIVLVLVPRRPADPPVRPRQFQAVWEGEGPSPLKTWTGTYTLGQDSYDEFFTIETREGDFLGESGIGILEAIPGTSPKQVIAFDVGLFDKTDITTLSRVLMSERAYNDESLRAKIDANPQGEAILAEPGKTFTLETSALQVKATIDELVYGKGGNHYFERLTITLNIFLRETTDLRIGSMDVLDAYQESEIMPAVDEGADLEAIAGIFNPFLSDDMFPSKENNLIRNLFDISLKKIQGEPRIEKDEVIPKNMHLLTRWIGTYEFGHDLFDEFFSIELETGDFLGGCGVNILESVHGTTPKQVLAFDIGLFDKLDIVTVSRVVMSDYAYINEAIQANVEALPQAEAILAEPGLDFIIETSAMHVRARIEDMKYGGGENKYFTKLSLSMAVFLKEDVDLRIGEMDIPEQYQYLIDVAR
jgi:hypothetical protein